MYLPVFVLDFVKVVNLLRLTCFKILVYDFRVFNGSNSRGVREETDRDEQQK